MKNGTLSHYRREAPTVLKTDASKEGVAAILLQQIDDQWRIVCCCSRRLTAAETNYGITELEALAIVYAATKFRHYLLGKRFRIVSDHCALCSVFKKNSTSARLNRWRLLLQEFEYDVVYTKGTMHSDVDCLSRAPLADENDNLLGDRICHLATVETRTSVQATPLDPETWAKLTAADEEAKQYAVKAKHRRDGFKQVQGLLYNKNKLYVPAAKRKSIMQAAHAGPIAGHGGIKATLDRLESFWWHGITNDVKKFVESCHQCQLRKSDRKEPAGQLHPIAATTTLELVAFDCLGPLQESMNHKSHIMVAVDVFTRYVQAKAVKNVRASTFTKFLLQFISSYGVPKTILTDGAPTFINAQLKELLLEYDIQHRVATPHHHQGNAVVEKMIQAIQEKISIMLRQPNADLDWENSL